MDIELTNDGIQTPEDTEVPSAPTQLTSISQTTNSVDLTWEASSDNKGVHHYNIYRDGEKVQVTSKTYVTDFELNANTTYEYTATAVDAAGNESDAIQYTAKWWTQGDEPGQSAVWQEVLIY